ncbi:MAG: hypothetical protein JRE64_26330 [Deltaproteobacteria bacterium]|nr:hypothetical protein [Deltaproteobacteria bacterium]
MKIKKRLKNYTYNLEKAVKEKTGELEKSYKEMESLCDITRKISEYSLLKR